MEIVLGIQSCLVFICYNGQEDGDLLLTSLNACFPLISANRFPCVLARLSLRQLLSSYH